MIISPAQVSSVNKLLLTFCQLGIFSCFLSSAKLFSSRFFVVCHVIFKLSSKKSFRNTIRVSNSLDPDQDQHNVGPDLDLNCLQRLSSDKKETAARKELMLLYIIFQAC